MTQIRVLRLNYVWSMVCAWMALSGLLVLVVQCIGKLSLPEGGSIILYLYVQPTPRAEGAHSIRPGPSTAPPLCVSEASCPAGRARSQLLTW